MGELIFLSFISGIAFITTKLMLFPKIEVTRLQKLKYDQGEILVLKYKPFFFMRWKEDIVTDIKGYDYYKYHSLSITGKTYTPKPINDARHFFLVKQALSE